MKYAFTKQKIIIEMKLIYISFLSILFTTNVLKAQNDAPMNVIFILADDLGWSDTSLYGMTHFYETPNIERLAARGMTFTRAYAASPLCSPTRASILTGQTVARHGITQPLGHVKDIRLSSQNGTKAAPKEKAIIPISATRLDSKLPTLGKLFKKQGYQTAHFGKWHLGSSPYSPLEHGFDVDIPHWPGPGPAGSFVAPWKFPNFNENYPKEHIEDRMAEEAVGWMRKHDKNSPFFMNYWQFSVHAPFDAKESLIKYYRTKVDFNDSQHSPTYASMVHSLDDAVGKLLDEIDRSGRAENTIIIFFSDNGGNMYDGIVEELPNGEQFLTSPTSNRPLRGGKATIYEGGIRVPAIVIWPGITAPGSISNQIIQSTDFYPTLLEQMNMKTPENHTVDGINIIEALKGGNIKRNPIITYFPYHPPVPEWLPASISAHDGDWKLIKLFHQGENQNHAYKLYNLKWDVGEVHDLSNVYPEKVKKLDAYIIAHLKDANAVVPVPNPKFNPAEYAPEKIGIQPNGPRNKIRIEVD